MPRSTGWRAWAIAALLALAGCGGDGAPIVYRPHTVLDVPARIDITGVPDIADPCVLWIDRRWYVYATNTKTDLEVFVSDDLDHWSSGGIVWEPTPGSWNSRGEIWAPHVQRAPEGFYLYYTANRQIGVAFATSPLGPFEEVFDHPFVGGGYGGVGQGTFFFEGTHAEFLDFDEQAIDAFVLAASDGSLTFYAATYTPLSVISAWRMLDPVTLADPAPRVVLALDLFSWENIVREGPWVIEHDGVFHLTYSGSGANLPSYAIGEAVGPTPLGPFERRADNPILHQDPDPAQAFWGPGHHAVVEGAFGDLLLVYHSKVSPEVEFDRRLRYAPVSFDGSGRLVFDTAPP